MSRLNENFSPLSERGLYPPSEGGISVAWAPCRETMIIGSTPRRSASLYLCLPPVLLGLARAGGGDPDLA
jgi:hypothetical protein